MEISNLVSLGTGVVVPLVTNVVKSIFSSKDTKNNIDSATQIKLAELEIEKIKATSEVDKSRLDSIKTTLYSGIKWVDSLTGIVRAVIGFCVAFVIVGCVFGENNLLTQEQLNNVVMFVVGYYFSALSAYKAYS